MEDDFAIEHDTLSNASSGNSLGLMCERHFKQRKYYPDQRTRDSRMQPKTLLVEGQGVEGDSLDC